MRTSTQMWEVRVRRALRRPIWSLVVAAIAVLATMAAACGGGEEGEEERATPAGTATEATTTPQGRRGDEIDPCALVTKDDAEDALGEPVAEPSFNDAAGILTCSYTSESFNIAAISVWTENAETVFEGSKSIPTAEAVSGIGDDAFWLADFQQLWVLKGDVTLSVIVGLADEDAAREGAKALAQKASERLP